MYFSLKNIIHFVEKIQDALVVTLMCVCVKSLSEKAESKRARLVTVLVLTLF